MITDVHNAAAGIISARNILKAWGRDLNKVTSEDILQPFTVTISPESSIEEAVKLQQAKRIEHLVIVSPQGRRAVGILTTFDIVEHMAGMTAGTLPSGMELRE